MAFAGTCGLLHSHLPFPSVPDVAPRFRYFEEHKDEFNVIFIGSSRIRHGIVPEQFDEAAAKSGFRAHSFNLGYSGMWPPESYYYLRQVLALHPKKLRWVFIELMDYRFGQAEGEAPTMRSLYWHDVPHTVMAWRMVAESQLPFTEKVELFATHTKQFAQNMTNSGRGAERLEQRYFPVKKKIDTSWIARRGFDPEPTTEWSEAAKVEYQRQIALFQQPRPQKRMRPGLLAEARKLAWELKRDDVRPIFLVPPTVRVEEHFDEVSLEPGPVFAFDDPARFPRLYLPESHYDPGHLNEAGAREFCDMLGEQFADVAVTSILY